MSPIVFYDRYDQQTKTEKVYGDGALKWTYGTFLGKLSLSALVKRAVFSKWYGWRMDRPASKSKVRPFVQEYELDPLEFQRDVDDFATFNEFFYRKLKPECRPINAESDSVVFPADGRHLCVPDLSKAQGLFVKGQMFDIHSLIQDAELSSKYANGSLLLSRLCPVDYHRFHFPAAGTALETRLINGPLYSVNPIALCQNIHILTTNKRTITELQTDNFGTVLCIEVGATCVGGIVQTYEAGQPVEKGDEKGYFRFGGSSTITVFEPNRIRFDDDLVSQSSQQTELYAKIGDRMGHAV